jgi:hypothetical protein
VLTDPFDPTALVDDIDRDALLAYRSELPKPLGRSRAWLVLGVVASTLSFVGLIAFWVRVIGLDGFGRADLGQWTLYSVGALLYSAIPILIVRTAVREWRGAGGRRQFRLSRFAADNGMHYRPVPSALADPLPGLVFGPPVSAESRDILWRTDDTGLLIGDTTVSIGTGKGKKVHQWGFASVRLGTRLPHLVLDARGNNSIVGATNLPGDLDRDQRLSLEGDFDKHFTLYCPRGYERDALYLFTPDVMARFVDSAAEVDIEIVDDRLFLYSPRPLATLDPDTWEWIHGMLVALTEKVEQWRRWRDGRLGATRVEDGVIVRPPRGVARAGRRLTSTVPWWQVVLGFVALAVGLWAIGTDILSLFD